MGGIFSSTRTRRPYESVTDTKIAVEKLQKMIQNINPGNIAKNREVVSRYNSGANNVRRAGEANLNSAGRTVVSKKLNNARSVLGSDVLRIRKVLQAEKEQLNRLVIPKIQNIQGVAKASSNRRKLNVKNTPNNR